MSKLLQTSVDNQMLYIEVDSYGTEKVGVRPEEVLEKTRDAFERAKATISSITQSMVSTVQSMSDTVRPDEFELEFAIKFNAEGQVVLAKAAAEASLKVTMTYKKKE
jgi:hypothetical protein